MSGICLRHSLNTGLCEPGQITRVFTTNKTLNDRFTRKLHRRVTLSDKNEIFEDEKEKIPQQNLAEIAKKRRRVLMPSEVKSEHSTQVELSDNATIPENINIRSTPKLDIYKKNSYITQHLKNPEKSSFKRCLTDSAIASTKLNSVNNLADSERSNPIIFSSQLLSHLKLRGLCKSKGSLYKWKRPNREDLEKEIYSFLKKDSTSASPKNGDLANPQPRENAFSPVRFPRVRRRKKPSYKWKPRKPTKEELDDEIDSYMAEVKEIKPSSPLEDDPFIEEYMMEVEKSINQTAESASFSH